MGSICVPRLSGQPQSVSLPYVCLCQYLLQMGVEKRDLSDLCDLACHSNIVAVRGMNATGNTTRQASPYRC